ncbi:MAG: DUF2238 domain-containing protein [Planctomycetes bacterium]|nr:DUF2238 domain-containing protein [Planctomycetota bacterium]
MTATPAQQAPRRWWFAGWVAICAGFAGWSLAGAVDRAVWAFEVMPLGVVLLLLALLRRWRLSDLAFGLLTVFFVVQCVGGRYTFAEVPVPRALLDALGLARNPVDRIGHFCQGFVPAILLREWLLRRLGLPRGAPLFWLVTGCCLGFSAGYELLEMAVVLVFYPGAGPEWLGTQGDPWDAQWDMATALAGALLAQLLLRRWHDRSLQRVAPEGCARAL